MRIEGSDVLAVLAGLCLTLAFVTLGGIAIRSEHQKGLCEAELPRNIQCVYRPPEGYDVERQVPTRKLHDGDAT